MRVQGLLLTFTLGLLAPGGVLAYITDRKAHLPLNYSILVPPPAGQSYLDPVFGTAIRRVSDTRSQPSSATAGTLPYILNEYSTMSPFNQDNSWLLLMHHSIFALYDGEGRYHRDLPLEILASTEPRWSRRNPTLLYYIPVYGNSLLSYDVATGVRTVVRRFAEYSTVSGRGESDICFDGDHLVLVGDNRDIFVYELSTDTKGPVLDAGGRAFDQVYIAPDDNVLVGWLQAGTSRFNGVELYDRNMNFQRQLASAIGHMDVGRDTDGQAVLLWMNTADPQAPSGCQNALVKVRLADAQRTCLLSLDWSLAAHVSAPDGGDWFFVSTYAPGDPQPLPADWRLYTGEVLQVRLDGSEVRRLAHHRSRPFNEYSYMPRASVSRDGRRLVYSSNYGLPSVLGYPNYYSDVYLLDVAATSASYPGSSSPVSTRYEQDNASVSYSGPWYQDGYFVNSGGSAVLAMDAGARSTFTFSGSGVRLIGYRDQWAGIARVYLDGQLRSVVDSYASPAKAQDVLFSASDLAAGRHTLDVEVTGTRNALSGGSWVWLDAFEVLVQAEQDDPAASYAGTWYQDTNVIRSGQSAALAMDPGSRASFRFSGDAVTWIGHRDERSGIGRVYLDGTLRAEIDTYAATFQPQVVVYTLSGLPPGEHTLAIEVTDRRHPLSLGNWIWVDAFLVAVPVPDTTPPTVTVTSPSSGAAVTGTITVSASAADNVSVAGIQFQLDGAPLGSEDTTVPYSVPWNTTTAAAGTHTLRAIARDTAGNTSASSLVTVTVPDTTPPTVTITSPVSGSTVAATIIVSASASDNVAVAGVQFRLDGVSFGPEDTTAPYSLTWDTHTTASGTHTLTAIARDAANNTGTSSSVTVTVPDTTPPTVTITAPGSGSTVAGTVTVSASASDNVRVVGVQFRLDGAPLGPEDTTNPHSVTWDTTTAANGSHVLSAVASDGAGNTTTSSSVTVTVSNAPTSSGPDLFVALIDGRVQWWNADGTLRQTLTRYSDGQVSSLAFDSAGHLYVPHWWGTGTLPMAPGNAVVRYDGSGNFLGTFGSGYSDNPSSLAFDAQGNTYVGQAGNTGDILKFDVAGNLVASFDVATGKLGTDHIDLASNGCTIFYTSRTPDVLRFDVCTNTQLPKFNTEPLPGYETYHLRILPDGGVLVANTQVIVRLDASGNLVQTYFAPGEINYWGGVDHVGDGTFWASNAYTANIYRFDLQSGAVLASFNTGTGDWSAAGLGVRPIP